MTSTRRWSSIKNPLNNSDGFLKKIFIAARLVSVFHDLLLLPCRFVVRDAVAQSLLSISILGDDVRGTESQWRIFWFAREGRKTPTHRQKRSRANCDRPRQPRRTHGLAEYIVCLYRVLYIYRYIMHNAA